MERLLQASHEGDINSLYSTIQEDPTILRNIDATPFINTPLHIAASAGHIEFAMEIARLKPSFARKPNQQGSTPMHVALEQNQTKMASWLLHFDAELVRVKGREGITPLHNVVERGELDLLKIFLSSCDRSIKDLTIRNETVFHLSLKNDKIQAFDLLFEKLQSLGIEDSARILNAQDLEGNTVLHLAAATNQYRVIKSLLKWHKSSLGKVQIGARNENDQTAMEIAIAHRHRGIQRLLKPGRQKCAIVCSYLKKSCYSGLRSWFGMGTSRLESSYGVSDKKRSDLLVVAALLAAASFQVVLNPPGGLKDDGHYAKLSTDTNSYALVMFCNTIVFYVSICTIVWLIGNFPMFWTFYVAVIAMAITYDSSLAAITQDSSVKTLLKNVALITPFVVVSMIYGGHITRWLLFRRELKSKSASADENV